MIHLSFLEHSRDHLIQGRVLDTQIDDGVTLKNGSDDFGHARTLDLEPSGRPLAIGHLAEST
jgi:hypothetical protein